MIFHENCLLADNSHEISYLIFFENLRKSEYNSLTKKRYTSQNLSSAAVVIDALRVNSALLQRNLVLLHGNKGTDQPTGASPTLQYAIYDNILK